MSPEERELWAQHLDLRRAIDRAYFRRRIKEARKLEREMRALEDRIFAHWRQPKPPPQPPERFSYKIPVMEGETGQVLRYSVADQDGVHGSTCGRRPPEAQPTPAELAAQERWSRAIEAVDRHALQCDECRAERPREGRNNRRYEPHIQCRTAVRLETEERRAREAVERLRRAGVRSREKAVPRDWLKVIEPSPYAHAKAAKTWVILEHSGRPQCPGCGRRKELVYLEFRNWDDDAKYKIPHVLAVCDMTASALIERSGDECFGVTALGRGVPWPCRESRSSAGTPLHHADEPTPVQPSRRGGWRGKLSSLAALARARASRSRGSGGSLSAESA